MMDNNDQWYIHNIRQSLNQTTSSANHFIYLSLESLPFGKERKEKIKKRSAKNAN